MKIDKKTLAYYLPYDLYLKNNCGKIYRLKNISTKGVITIIGDGEVLEVDINKDNSYAPILKPLTDLYEWNQKGTYEWRHIDTLRERWGLVDVTRNGDVIYKDDIVSLFRSPFMMVQQLIRLKYDVFCILSSKL